MMSKAQQEAERLIEVRITNHVGYAAKWSYYDYGDRYPNENYGSSYSYRHAKFRLPSGKPRCIRFAGDVTDDTIILEISKKYSSLKSTFVKQTQPS